ncbi:MAG: saccharopine dehydrogenase NADP-binding domain-containing protein [Saprospiraceae bacterium]
MKKKIMILGGYGGVGKIMSRNLLKHTDSDITISGHNKEKAEKIASILRIEYPKRQILSSYADATQKHSLIEAFKNVDLVIITTTTPDYIGTIAEAALESETDMIDILVRGDVVDSLGKYRERIIANKRIFITQAGFHPGLPAPIIKYVKNKFDNYKSANVVMVMNSLFESPESTHEIIHEIAVGNAKILKNGIWKKATYKDALKIQFSDKFGARQCFPLQMREIYPLQKELGVSEMGVYSAGFNPFIDNFVFPFVMFLQFLKKGFGKRFCGKLMYWGIKKYYNNKPGVEFYLQAMGIKDGKKRNFTLKINSSDAFDFTAIAVIACLKQYLDNSINNPDLYLMGNVVDEKRVIEDLKLMGLQITGIG